MRTVRLSLEAHIVAIATCIPACSNTKREAAALADAGSRRGSLEAGGADRARPKPDARPDASGKPDTGSCSGAPCDGACVGSRCLVALAGSTSPVDVVVDARSAYFTSCSGSASSLGAVFGVPLGGGARTVLVEGPGCPIGLAVDHTSVYVAGLNDGGVMKISLGGGPPLTLASGDRAVAGVAVDGASVYWASSAGTLLRAPVDGGAPTVLAAGQKSATRPIVDGASVYWGDRDRGTVQKLPLDGGAPMTVTDGLDNLSALALGSKDVYIADGYLLRRAPRSGGPPSTVSTAAGDVVVAVAVDDTSAYFTSQSAVWKVSLDGGPPVAIASDQGEPNAITVDATSVYWTNAIGSTEQPGECCGQVMKLTPK